MRAQHIEDTLQMHCVAWFGLQYPNYRRLLHHSPNGGRREIREAARFRRMGVQAGFPDLILMQARGKWHALCVELKTATGRQSAVQREMQSLLTSAGYRYEVARSLDEFIRIINNYLDE